jgi:hypothetical protein
MTTDNVTDQKVRLEKLSEGKHTFVGIYFRESTGVIFLFRQNEPPMIAFANSHIGKQLLERIDDLENTEFEFTVEIVTLGGKYKGVKMRNIKDNVITIIRNIDNKQSAKAQYKIAKLSVNDLRDSAEGTN